MNSYNDNLHSTVVGALSSQDLEKKSAKSTAIASMFTLYHAEAATITAEDKLEDAKKSLKQKKNINDQAVASNNLSNNMLSSATQANNYVKQSVTNTAVCAANVKASTDAIVKLASDMGSVYSIVNAADFHSDIYNLTSEARTLINETAYLAEVASDLSMDASITISEVPFPTVLDKAKSSSGSLTNLLGITTGDFNTAAQTVTDDTNAVSTASVSEQVAEGGYEDSSVDYQAVASAYHATNRELNLNLSVHTLQRNADEMTEGQGEWDSRRQVSFAFLRSAFPKESVGEDALYPVKNYYLFVVKDQAKSTFGITNADTIIANPSVLGAQFIELPDLIYGTGTASNEISGITLPNGVVIYPGTKYARVTIDFLHVNDKPMIDSDGEAVTWGQDYVMFVVARYEESYKRKINTFDDFISATSTTFTLRHQLAAAQLSSLTITPNTTGEDPKEPYQASFKVTDNPQYNVEYRLLFLPYEGVSDGMLTTSSFLQIDQELINMIITATEYDQRIAQVEAELANPELTTEQAAALNIELQSLEGKRNAAYNNQLAATTAGTNDVIIPGMQSPSFIFNRMLAEQIPPGNYIPFTEFLDGSADATGTKRAKKSAAETSAATAVTRTLKPVPFGEETTDIFGNLLGKNKTYLPVILSVFNGEEQNEPSFHNAWTNYTSSPVYTYPDKLVFPNPAVSEK